MQDIGNPKRHVPRYPCAGWSVLDIGCGMGQTLAAPEFAEAAERYGIDPDQEAVGACREPGLRLRCASAERTGLPSEEFDLVYSRVSLPYTYLQHSLPEMHRLLKPGGHLWITLHPWTLELGHLAQAIRTLNPKLAIDRLYVLANGVYFWLTGRCVARPWGTSVESVQFAGAIRRALRRSGLVDVKVERGRHFLVTGRKPPE